MANIMYRVDSAGNVFGVLNDFDLSSLIPIEEATSLRRTGTPPYMAFDLLKEEKDSGPHLYRHDLEALFYVMLMICCRHSIINEPQPYGTSQLREIPTAFSKWFERERSWDDLAEHKRSFFVDDQPLPLSPCFEGFRRCLSIIRSQFAEGIFERTRSKKQPEAGSWKALPLPADINIQRRAPAPPAQKAITKPFNDATLGGRVDYTEFLAEMWTFKGKELIVRNKDPTPEAEPS